MGMNWGRLWQVMSPAMPSVGQVVLFCIVLLGLILAIVKLRQWMDDRDDSKDSAVALLEDLREAYAQGGLTEEEYRSIKAKLARTAVGAGGAPAKAVASESSMQTRESVQSCERLPEPTTHTQQGVEREDGDHEEIGTT